MSASAHVVAVSAAALAGVAVWVAGAPSRAVFRLRGILVGHTPSPLVFAVRRTEAAARELRRRRRRVRERRAEVIELCDGISAELVAGRAPEIALAYAAAVLGPEFGSMFVAMPCGSDIADALDRLAESPGAEGLRLLAGCWRIGAERGGAFGGAVAGLAAALRDEEAHRAEVAAQLAGPRATARLLAVLPLLGLAMAAALGARPLAFLLGTLPGVICLLTGIALDALGLWWTRRLAAGAETPR
jgi:tight adherence protein B